MGLGWAVTRNFSDEWYVVFAAGLRGNRVEVESCRVVLKLEDVQSGRHAIEKRCWSVCA